MSIRQDVISTGLFYHGNKYKLLRHFLMDLLPTGLDSFIDAFAGSGTVSINVDAKNYYINEYDDIIFNILNLFKKLKPEEIIYEIEYHVNKYDLPKFGTAGSSKEIVEKYKQNFYEFRKLATYYNNPIYIYILHFYSFTHIIRFNKFKENTSARGNSFYSFEKDAIRIANSCKFFSQQNVNLLNLDFNDIDYDNILKEGKNNFVYFDPPYIKTADWYSSGYNKYDDYRLMNLADELNSKGVKFGISNNIDNEDLILWAKDNNYNIAYQEYVYTGNGKRKTTEIYIYNYDIQRKIKELMLNGSK